MSHFADTIMKQKYSHTLKNEEKESWENIAYRVTKAVMKSVDINMRDTLAKDIFKMIKDRKFIPGGRYLYASGNPFHQVQNCLLLKAEDSREGWSELLQKASMALMTGAGIGVDYSDIRAEGKPIRKTGGTATGPIALMQMLNECGRGIMQGGSRRSAIWAGLNWNHPDIHKFIKIKNWSDDVKKLKEKNFSFPATLDMTNISILLDDLFFEAINDDKHILYSHAQSVYWATVEQMLTTAEPGFSIDVGENKGETLRNACVTGDTEILTREGYIPIEHLVGEETIIWNGFEWSKVTPKITGRNVETITVNFNDGRKLTCTKNHKFHIIKDYTDKFEIIEAKNLEPGMKLVKCDYPVLDSKEDLEDAYTNGFVAADGMELDKTLYVYKSKEVCLEKLNKKVVKWEENYNRYRVILNKVPLSKNFVPLDYSVKSKIEWLSGLFDGDGCELKEGGLQLVSINKNFIINLQKLLTTLSVQSKIVPANDAGYRELPDHKGGKKLFYCKESHRICIGAMQMQTLKSLGLDCLRLHFNKTPQRDASQYIMVTDIQESGISKKVYCFNEPKNNTGIFNGIYTGQCTEITSADDSDICNLGSINMARISSIEEMEKIVELSTAFLLAGTVYSDVPYSKVDMVRTKNRRLGLGLMGLHEWLLLHGKLYGPDKDLEEYLKIYAQSTKIAHKYADKWELSRPIKTRSLAPTGSIGILAETTTGCEPIFCVAYKRRYLKHKTWMYQYVIDPTAKRLIEDYGVNPDSIEDAYSLAENVERRVEFQAWLQQYVDHGISSTINLPAWGSKTNNNNTVQDFGNMLLKYLPNLRGITVYPDGARGGQPLTPVKYQTAMKHVGEDLVEEAADICDITGKGSCGT